ncbi:response regulator, partial [Paracraurococcus ruber]
GAGARQRGGGAARRLPPGRGTPGRPGRGADPDRAGGSLPRGDGPLSRPAAAPPGG